MKCLCDIKINKELFNSFKIWYIKQHPNFKGVIRMSAESLGVADIIDENQNLRKFRYSLI